MNPMQSEFNTECNVKRTEPIPSELQCPHWLGRFCTAEASDYSMFSEASGQSWKMDSSQWNAECNDGTTE